MVSKVRNKILVVLPTFGDTKDSKRIKLLKDAGFEVNIAYFERDNFLARIPEADSIINLGKIEDGRYFKRIKVYLKSIFKLREQAKTNDLIYSVGADLAIFSFISALGLRKKSVIDVADIRPIQVSNGIIGWILRKIEKFVTKKSSLVVLTSQGFIKNYYHKKLKLNKVDYFLLENKVDFNLNPLPISGTNENEKIVLGYFGAIRDKWSLMLLNQVTKKHPDKFEAVIAGINLLDTADFLQFTEGKEGIKCLGPYKSPDDLPELYDQIDVMLTFYPDFNSTKEWFDAKRICRSNRFYESCMFKKPLLAFSFTDDGKEVEKLGIGLTLDNYDLNYSVEKISSEINFGNIQKWKRNIVKIPKNVFQLSDEKEKLAIKLKGIINKKAFDGN